MNEIFSSIVMPVHNGDQFLHEAIESVLNQTYTNYEFLIIENCSTDSSLDIIKSYDDPRIKLIIEKDCGQVQAYNRGFKEANGEFIFIHDQDDVSYPKRFEKQLECMIKKNIDICGTFIKIIDEKDNAIYQTSVPVSNDLITERLLYDLSVIHNSSVCIKKNVFDKIGLWDEKYFPVSDAEFYQRARDNFLFANIPEIYYVWRKHKQQLSNKQTKESRRQLKQLEINYLLKKKDEFALGDYFFYKCLIYYYTDYLTYAWFYNILSMFYGNIKKKVVRYFIIMTVFGLPLKIFRKFNLVYSPLFVTIRTKFNKLFG